MTDTLHPREQLALQWASPIHIPRKRRGRFSIVVRKDTGTWPIVSEREAILRGLDTAFVDFRKPRRTHLLKEHHPRGHGTSTWMTDRPQELRQIYEALHATHPQGYILVGGLGLGLLPTLLSETPGVVRVDVVEREPDVIGLVYQPGRSRYVPIRADIHAFLTELPRWRYDLAYLDTWTGTSESTWFEEVLPLRRLIARRFGARTVHCWAEDQMLGQIEAKLNRLSGRDPVLDKLRRSGASKAELKAFGVGVQPPHWWYSYLPFPMDAAAINRFLTPSTNPTWEHEFGAAIDRFEAEQVEEDRLAHLPS